MMPPRAPITADTIRCPRCNNPSDSPFKVTKSGSACRKCIGDQRKATPRLAHDRTDFKVGDRVVWSKPHRRADGSQTGRTVATECVIVSVSAHQFRVRCDDGQEFRAYHSNVRGMT